MKKSKENARGGVNGKGKEKLVVHAFMDGIV